ncbi:MAG: SDR family NAD(P)-dependent oxidoreductase [Actinobacteria bacterium]|nr:SDR family NAD(P)-dependent oxidoreductase [Actinomycetota bacterium]
MVLHDGTIVITGAATGIGRRAAVQLTRRGRHVIVVTRSDDRATGVVEAATSEARDGGRITSVPADLADLGQVRRAAAQIADLGPVHAIVNNAAILAIARRRPRLTVDGVEEVFAVNHVAPFVLTTALRTHLTGRGRAILAGSKGLVVLPWLRLDLDDLDSSRRWSPVRAYYRSKLAQLAFAAELCRRGVDASVLRIPSVRVDHERLAAYPRLVRLAYQPKLRVAADPTVVAARYVDLVTATRAVTGHVDMRLRPVRWPGGTHDARLGAQVWSATEALATGRS